MRLPIFSAFFPSGYAFMKKSIRLSWLVPFVVMGSLRAESEVTLTADFSHEMGTLNAGFWSSSGLTQEYETNAFRQNMRLVGSVPYVDRRWMRPHDLLNLVVASDLGTDHPSYDWKKLDEVMDAILRDGLTPIFEVMGNPSNYFSDFLDRGQLLAWKRLVTDVALHLEKRYGEREVRAWLFESWNEPDIDNGWKWKTQDEHSHYYDACSEGLKEADPQLRFGGPGLSRRKMPYPEFLQGFLNHCDTGTNYFTNEKGVRLDFISIHCKKMPAAMVTTEVENINALLRDHPTFASKLFLNDEADSEVGWNDTKYEFRATPWYAAFIARSANEHLIRIADGRDIAGHAKINFQLSNDDAFWGPFVYRAQCVRFGTDDRCALIKKPAREVRTALALLGDERCDVTGAALEDSIGAIATKRGSSQVAVLLYHHNDDPTARGESEVQLKLRHLPFSSGRLAIYRIDAAHGDTYAAWKAMGSPEIPSDDQIEQLRAKQEFSMAEPATDFEGRSFNRTISLPMPGVCVVVLSRDPKVRPAQVDGVVVEKYSSLSGARNDFAIGWRSGSRFTKTYEVLHADKREGPYTRVNSVDQIDTAFVLSRPSTASGFVKVRSVDYWNRSGPESEAVALDPSAAPEK
jgi:L-iduronidase